MGALSIIMNPSDKKMLRVLTLLPVVALVFFIGVYVGGRSSTSQATSSNTANSSTALDSINVPINRDLVDAEKFKAFWKAWVILDQKYVAAASTTEQDRIYGAIKGLASSYGDPYTVFFPPQESKMFAEDISGNFEGVGMEIGIKNNQLQVVTPLKGSPAEAAGVKTGDQILKIGDTIVTPELSVDAAVKLIRGPHGTTVKILFLTKDSSKPIERSITRQIINIPTLETSSKPGGIFVIRLFSFTAQSPELFRNALREFVLSGDHKLIFDLRGNPGGYLEAAWDMASWFLPAGKTVVTEDFGKNGSPKSYRSKGYDIFNDNLRMIILTDGGSASASEILAGALHEQGVAKLVGSKTFGKGSVQELVDITSDTSLKVTIARWLTPNGHNLSHEGLDPDYPVKVTAEDVAAGKDAAMDKAVELLTVQQ